MGKRSSFERRERDFYPTPEKAVQPLEPYLEKGCRVFEPCAGDGALVSHLEALGVVCVGATDIKPQAEAIAQLDALSPELERMFKTYRADVIVTNPPWERETLHAMIEHFRAIAPTWLLFDADWWHTKQSAPFAAYCERIVPIGRVKWIEGSKHTGKDNAAWYLFTSSPAETIIHPRAA